MPYIQSLHIRHWQLYLVSATVVTVSSISLSFYRSHTRPSSSFDWSGGASSLKGTDVLVGDRAWLCVVACHIGERHTPVTPSSHTNSSCVLHEQSTYIVITDRLRRRQSHPSTHTRYHTHIIYSSSCYPVHCLSISHTHTSSSVQLVRWCIVTQGH